MDDESGLIDIEALSEELTDTVLGPYIRFDPRRKEFVPTVAWHGLDNKRKILAYLVARKGTYVRGVLGGVEAVSPKAVAADLGLPPGSVNPALADMFKARDVEKDDNGRYFVPNRALLKVKVMYDSTSGSDNVPTKTCRSVRRKPARGNSRRKSKGNG